MMDVTVVLIDRGKDSPHVVVFEDEELAIKWAEVRGAAIDISTLQPISDPDARRMIVEEVKDRRDEDRMRRAGL